MIVLAINVFAGASSQPLPAYRKDIDGLRAFAVVAVILFHLGLLPNGYLGVDIFFVISGFLITGIVYREACCGTYTLAGFYERRIRRILPLALFITAVALGGGFVFMLPDDLENLGQSVIATNLFANNILQAITTRNYWDVVNEYKPLMHTWSLGIEEQFYLLYPLLFLPLKRFGSAYLLPVIGLVSVISLSLYLAPLPEYQKFYYLPFRFFELAAGGVVGILQTKRSLIVKGSEWAIVPLVIVAFLPVAIASTPALLITVILSCVVVSRTRPGGSVHSLLLENRWVVFLGAISYSLYMWHQVVFAYARYGWVEELRGGTAVALVVLVFILSICSYYFIEQPFRNREKCSVRLLISVVLGLACATTLVAGWLYLRAGVVRDVPELEIVAGSGERGMHAHYNRKINQYDRDFPDSDLKVLVIGNSFARDWTNVLLESQWGDKLNLSYLPDPNRLEDLRDRWKAADVVFWSEASRDDIKLTGQDRSKLYVVGTKNFGKSAGIFYNHRGADYYVQKVLPDRHFTAANVQGKEWHGERYIDLLEPVMDAKGWVRIFTPSGKFISQDCRHLTRAGAKYYAELLSGRLDKIFGAQDEPK